MGTRCCQARVAESFGVWRLRQGVLSLCVDRAAQLLQPESKFFHRNSYGYRPGKSAPEAVKVCREMCWKYDWLLDVDIQKFFDTIDHELMKKAVEKHCPDSWMRLYIE